MKIGAIISEYNPFHNGHKYQIDMARKELELDAVVSLMSGSFVQRGECAIYSKEIRTKAVLACGVDLVLENPTVFVLRSAEGYADASVRTLDALGCVDYLVFGAECGDISKLHDIAELLTKEGGEFKTALTRELSKGLPYAVARSRATASILGDEAEQILSQPNNILAIEYLKAVIRQGSLLKPYLIKRAYTEHNSPIAFGEFASASHIREELQNCVDNAMSFVPEEASLIYREGKIHSGTDYDKAVLSAICLMQKRELKNVPDISEGLENKIKSAVMRCDTLDELLEAVKSKRYAYSRLKRAMLCAFLGITRADAEAVPKYIKVLDFNSAGQRVLNIAKSTASLPIAKSASPILKDDEAMALWKRELEFERVFNLM